MSFFKNQLQKELGQVSKEVFDIFQFSNELAKLMKLNVGDIILAHERDYVFKIPYSLESLKHNFYKYYLTVSRKRNAGAFTFFFEIYDSSWKRKRYNTSLGKEILSLVREINGLESTGYFSFSTAENYESSKH